MTAGKGWFVADHLGRYSIPELVEAEQALEFAAHNLAPPSFPSRRI